VSEMADLLGRQTKLSKWAQQGRELPLITQGGAEDITRTNNPRGKRGAPNKTNYK